MKAFYVTYSGMCTEGSAVAVADNEIEAEYRVEKEVESMGLHVDTVNATVIDITKKGVFRLIRDNSY